MDSRCNQRRAILRNLSSAPIPPMADPQALLQAYFCDLVCESLLHAANCRIEQIDSDKPRYVFLLLFMCAWIDPELGQHFYAHHKSLLIVPFSGHHKCRELWPNQPLQYEKIFNIFLDLLLLVVPLMVLGAAYFLISKTLWQSMDSEKQLVKQTSSE